MHSFPRHSHHKYCIGIVEKGCRNFSYQGVVKYIAPGDILFINRNEVHTCSAVDKKGHNYQMLCIDADYLHKLSPDRDKERPVTPCFNTKITANTDHFKKLLHLFSILAESESVLEKESILLDIYAELIVKQGDIAPAPTRFEPGAVKRIREYLETNYAENVSIEQLSQIAGLSPYYLIRVFGEKTGLPPHSFQTQIRVKQAKFKLLQGRPMIDIALETGFADQSHFTKLFKRLVGITPGEFLKNNLRIYHDDNDK